MHRGQSGIALMKRGSQVRMQLRSFFRIVAIAALCCSAVSGAVDLTLEEDAVGADVVQAVIAKLDSSGMFGSDHRLLRRIAFVESEDGANNVANSTHGGGIWDVKQSMLDGVITASVLAGKRDEIWLNFGIEWSRVTEDDLRKPFYAGLAARLYLYYLETTATASIPLAGDIQGQAQFWFDYYYSNGGGINVDYFVMQVTTLDQKEGCKVNTDLFFVLDGSGSIGSADFTQVRQFEYDFVSQLDVGPQDNQVGTIIFSSGASVLFNLNTYENKSDILSAIQNIPYPGGNTNTPDGLCKLVRYGFTEENGARPTSAAVFRVAIVMTDGQSNKESTECQWDTLQAAEAVHELRPTILVYVIGVTHNVNQQELEAIATSPEYVTYLNSFDRNIIQEAQEEHIYEVCKKVSVPADTSNEMNGTLDEDESVRYHFPIPVVGITVRICVSGGHVIVYGSVSVPNPNSAFYDWLLDLEYGDRNNETEICDNVFVDPSKIPTKAPPTGPPTSQSSRASPSTPSTHNHPAHPLPTHTVSPQATQAPQPSMSPGSGAVPNSVELSDETLYLSVVGRHRDNNFVLNGSVGDVYNAATPETTPTSTDSTTTDTVDDGSDDDMMLIIVVAGSSGFALLVFSLCILVPCCICACCVSHRRKKQNGGYRVVSRKEDGQKLMPLNVDSV